MDEQMLNTTRAKMQLDVGIKPTLRLAYMICNTQMDGQSDSHNTLLWCTIHKVALYCCAGAHCRSSKP